MKQSKYKAGQIWNYETRDQEEGSRIFIVRVEPDEKIGSIFHIYVDGLKIRNPQLDSGFQDYLPHSPISEETLNLSVTDLVAEEISELPDVSDGYREWKGAFDSGNAGVFTIPVSEIVQVIEDVVSGESE